jgi:hypothetical protein
MIAETLTEKIRMFMNNHQHRMILEILDGQLCPKLPPEIFDTWPEGNDAE